jgi:predicted transcriptional regulator
MTTTVANIVTVSELAAELGVTGERVRQLIAETSEQSDRPIGRMAGKTIVLTKAEAAKVRKTHASKRPYTRQS